MSSTVISTSTLLLSTGVPISNAATVRVKFDTTKKSNCCLMKMSPVMGSIIKYSASLPEMISYSTS